MYRMSHRVLSTFKLVYGHLNGIFLTGNFAWALSRHFANSGPKDFAKGEMHKKAHQHIWLPFLQFSTVFKETLSISLFSRGRLNRALRSDLTLLFFSQFPRGDQRKKTQKPKKAEKMQPNVLMGLFMHFPFQPF